MQRVSRLGWMARVALALLVATLALGAPASTSTGQETDPPVIDATTGGTTPIEVEANIQIITRSQLGLSVSYEVILETLDTTAPIGDPASFVAQPELADGSIAMSPVDMVPEDDAIGLYTVTIELLQPGDWLIQFIATDPVAILEDRVLIDEDATQVVPETTVVPDDPIEADIVRPEDVENDLPSFLGIGLTFSVVMCLVVTVFFVRSRRRRSDE